MSTPRWPSVKRETGDEAGGSGAATPVRTVAYPDAVAHPDLGDDRFSIPRLSEGLVQRSRLIEDLESGVAGRPLTLISAPAGTGKTVLVSTWASRAQAKRTVAWVRLEAEDESPARFWSSFSVASKALASRRRIFLLEASLASRMPNS